MLAACDENVLPQPKRAKAQPLNTCMLVHVAEHLNVYGHRSAKIDLLSSEIVSVLRDSCALMNANVHQTAQAAALSMVSLTPTLSTPSMRTGLVYQDHSAQLIKGKDVVMEMDGVMEKDISATPSMRTRLTYQGHSDQLLADELSNAEDKIDSDSDDDIVIDNWTPLRRTKYILDTKPCSSKHVSALNVISQTALAVSDGPQATP